MFNEIQEGKNPDPEPGTSNGSWQVQQELLLFLVAECSLFCGPFRRLPRS